MNRRFFALILTTILLAAGNLTTVAADATPSVVSPAPAAALPTFAIYPKGTASGEFFDVKQDAGTTAKYTVVLANLGGADAQPFKGVTFAANVHIITNGGLASGQPNEAPVGPTAWLDYPAATLTLDPGKGVERTFVVVIPKETKPGQYVTSLVFQTADALEVPGTPNLKQVLRKTIEFMITVPGKVEPSFKIEDLHLVADETWSGVEATIVNTGNVLVRPAGTITISDLKGNPLMSQDLAFGSFYAFNSGLIRSGFGSNLPKGDYLLTLSLRDDATGATATVDQQKVTAMTQGEIDAASAPPVAFSAVTAVLKPNAKQPQFLDVSATITNTGDPVNGAEVNITAYKDGKLVETYVLVSPLALPKGDTTVNSRYIPADGFSKGAWTFKLSVQLRDKSGVAKVLNTVETGNPVNVP